MNKKTKLLGLEWDNSCDTINNNKLYLNADASTKRTILSTVQANFDPFGVCIPLLNRARKFLHELQCDKSILWDTKLQACKLKEWSNICKQINRYDIIELPRSVGRRDDKYNLLIYCDASKDFIGCSIYLNVQSTNSSQFIFARNSIVSNNLKNKSITVLDKYWYLAIYSI